MPSPSRSLIVLASLLSTCFGAFYGNFEDLPTTEYDYIVVGGGTAGNTVANRLSEWRNTTVLVLEAGPSNEGILNSQIPLLCATLSRSRYDWNYTTAPQVGFGGRTIPYPRGKVLGGSSTINFMVYNRGSKDDFDSYAKLSQNPIWSWASVSNIWARKNEKWVPPGDGHDTTGQYLPSEHSKSGVVSVSLTSYSTPPDDRVIATTKEFPDLFPYQIDHNAGDTIGVGWTQATVGDGQRSSSATAYLAPEYIKRPNLHVLLNAQATKVIQTGTKGGKPRFGAVEFARDASSPRHTVTAKREIILSAGSFNSPQLLMLSGIGDREALKQFGIETIVHNPSVGQNMSDHVLLANPYTVNSNDTFADHTAPDVIASEIARWNATHKGPLSYTITNQLAWLRLSKDDPIFSKYRDPSPGPTSAHHELIFSNGYAASGPIPAGDFFSVFTNVISPYSRGTLTLNSTDPFVQPNIDPRFLEHPFDIYTMVQSIKAARKFVTAKAWKDYILAPYGPAATANTDEEIAAYARSRAGSVWHAVGTATMSAYDAPYGVVDPDLSVKGTSGLRVVDASVIPYVPTAHTQGPVYIFAEVASDMIKFKQATGL